MSKPTTQVSAFSEHRAVDDSRRTSLTGGNDRKIATNEKFNEKEDGESSSKSGVLIVDWDGADDPQNPKK